MKHPSHLDASESPPAVERLPWRARTSHGAPSSYWASSGRPYYGWVLVGALGVTTNISYGTT